jgi:hypothetical protein
VALTPVNRLHDRRIDYGLAVADAAEGVDEDGSVEDAFLEQVADALRVLIEQPHRVSGLDVLRQKQDAGVGMRPTDPLGGDEALVGVRRRHADVDDCGIVPLEPDLAKQSSSRASVYLSSRETFAFRGMR